MPFPSVNKILELDLEFHRTIAQTLGNPQVDTVTSYIAKLTIPSRRETVQKWLDDGETERFLELHMQIVDVIAKRDTSRIMQAVEEHYVYWKK